MKIYGTITEFSPFHRGHQHLIHQIRKMNPDLIVVITSNYFTQRGLPSLLDPKDKTSLTLMNGADLVIELPELYTLQSADRFAKAAVQSLSSAGVTHLVFGSECNDLTFLKKLSHQLESLHQNPVASQSIMASLQKLSKEKYGRNLSSNDLLAVQYIYWCDKEGIQPVPIQRNQRFESATSLRKEIFSHSNWIYQSVTRNSFPLESLYPYIRYMLATTDNKELQKRMLMKEGIENRLKENAFQSADFADFLEQSISKTYTRARIQRTCVAALLQIEQKTYDDHADFYWIIPLGFNEKGRKHLKSLDSELILSSRRYWPDYLKSIRIKSRFIWQMIRQIPVKEELIKL